MRLIAMSSCHHLRHYSTLLLPYKINTIRKKTKGLTLVVYGALGIGHWAHKTEGRRGKTYCNFSPAPLLPHPSSPSSSQSPVPSPSHTYHKTGQMSSLCEHIKTFITY
ncbi:MAG: hypothetical protein V7L23_01805 [Nostoc sp.]|uniref:hypothetical protein n=1 Tax=Nostoc sp. TaxID=1180 RepID=UPI002FF41D94